ncbi:hypothetical protein [Amaricoccus macauensis]|uniref:hypothetical protein n=1 Tax=Amaricoccus macauensis TaxID=57001 RepID=UPI003C799AE7
MRVYRVAVRHRRGKYPENRGRAQTLEPSHFQFLRGIEDDGLHFDEIARTILTAYAFDEAEGFALSGPDVALPVSAASCIALILHELATNSIKHGAFSTTNGVVRLSWQIRALGASRSVAFCWQESGGPPVSIPKTERRFPDHQRPDRGRKRIDRSALAGKQD